MKYRADIDGLRAIAVLGVVAFHTGLGFLPGGYVGVDVFFVISGYLITRIVEREVADGSFTFFGFYARRVRRILPALLAIVLAVLVVGWFWLLPQEMKALGESAVATLLFASNFFFFKETGYFAPAAEVQPLIHTWSLAIEEQFYLVFPVLFVFATGRSARFKLLLPLGLGLASLAAAQVAVGIDPSAAFYITPFRVWEFAAGILLALTNWRSPDRLAPWSAGFGLLLVIGSMLLLEEDAHVPGLIGLIPVVGAVLMLADGRAGPVGRVLGFRPFVWIGLASYSIYLWHQPVFAFARLGTTGAMSAWDYAGLTALTLGLGAVTWRFVEQPWRSPKRIRTPIFAATGTALAALLVVVGIAANATGGLPDRLSKPYRDVLLAADPFTPAVAACRTMVKGRLQQTGMCHHSDASAGETVILFGDSHAEMLATQLERVLRARNARLGQITQPGCPPVDIGLPSIAARCAPYQERVDRIVEALPPGAKVIVSARWSRYVTPGPFDNGEGAGPADPEYRYVVALPQIRRNVEEALRSFVSRLEAKGATIALVHPVPEQGWEVPRRLALLMKRGDDASRPVAVSYRRVSEWNAPMNGIIERLEPSERLLRIPVADLVCDGDVAGLCVAERDGLPLYLDGDHFNERGALPLAGRIVARLFHDGSRETRTVAARAR